MAYIKRYRLDIWNFRLLTPYWGLLLTNKSDKFNSHLVTQMQVKITFKYFFFFFKKFKIERAARIKVKKPFIYRIDLMESRVGFPKRKYRFVRIRLVKFYYVVLNYRHLKQINRLSRKKPGLHESNFVLALECRLLNILYRSTFIDNIFRAMYYIKAGLVTVNWKVHTFFNVKVRLFNVVSFLPFLIYDIICSYFYRLTMNLIVHTPIRCLYISFFFFFYLFKMPRLRDIPNLKVIDAYRFVGHPLLF